MTLKLNNFLLIIFSIYLLSCSSDDDSNNNFIIQPSANFNFVVNNFVVSYSNTSENATSYLWNFGDGTTSDDENPNKTYTSNGTYEVTLTAIGNGSDSETKEIEIEVQIDLPENYYNTFYDLGGNRAYEIGSDGLGNYINEDSTVYYFDTFSDVKKQTIQGIDVFEIFGTSVSGSKVFWLKDFSSAGGNIIYISQNSASTSFIEYGSVVGMNVTYAMRQDGIEYVKIDNDTWEERNPDGSIINTYTEVQRDDWSVYMDRSDDAHLAIDVYLFQVKFRESNLPEFTDFYDIETARP